MAYDFAPQYLIMKELYGLGIRRIGVFGAPPLGCLPSQKTVNGDSGKGCIDGPNEAAKLFNSKLSAQLGYLNNNLHHAKVVYIDIYNPLLDIILYPKKYGNISFFFIFSGGLLYSNLNFLKISNFLCLEDF